MAPHNAPLYLLCFSLITILQSTLAQSDNYIIHMDPSATPKAFSDNHGWYLSTLTTISDITTTTATNKILSSSKHIYTYNHVMNGFSASLTPSELEALKGTLGYIFSVKDLPVKKHTTHTSEFLGLNPKFGAWPASEYGRDVIIGVVDTGVWPESESYNDQGMSEIPSRWKGTCESGTQFNSSMCNKKLIGARYFNRGLVAQLQKNVTIEMNSVRDTDGHGTHISSIAAGNYVKDASYFGYASGTANGVAPRAHVAMYKALWEEGPSVTSDVIAAIDHAISDGVDVLSISLGYPGVPLYLDPIALATFAAMEKGIFVSTSAGNSIPFFEELHNGIPWVLTVAAGTIDRQFGAILSLGNGVKIPGSALYTGDYNSTQCPIVFLDECKHSIELKKTGEKIVVCEEKDDNVYLIQVGKVRKANVTGGIFITNSTGPFPESTFPAVFMKPKDGETIKDYIERNKEPKVSLEFKITNLGAKPRPTVTDFSLTGPSQSCPFVLKPDIMAPGARVFAAWPSNIPVGVHNWEPYYTNFNMLSGTSVACPHVAGVAALLKSAHPEWSPAAIRSAMMTSADVTDNTHYPIKESSNNLEIASPIVMGAGHVNPNKALDPGLIYDVGVNDYVNLLCGMGFTANQIQAITRSSTTNCSAPSLDLNYPSFIAFFNVNDDSKSDMTMVQEFQRTVTNVGEGMSTYIAKVPTLEGLKVSVTPEKLVFKEKKEKQSYKLSIEGPHLMKQEQVFGFLIWEEVGGNHVVKSPIVATNINSDIIG
ncbi:subtilisin-like protease SBT3 [Tripterygium wilfordii]|uniref:subtilisin-like protease SBT3 n=1 Tax=Tripterygium wilfordii TaxID=458696 RepID=UPI0018F80873|nr:subtilisin-like protease SBT3 [Tripterygium wilfordii]